MDGPIALADWRRHIAELYAAVRASAEPSRAWWRWREKRDRLFREHPQSPLSPDDRQRFGHLSYFDYDPALRFTAETEPVQGASGSLPMVAEAAPEARPAAPGRRFHEEATRPEPARLDEAAARARPIVDWLLGDERIRAARTAVLFDRFARRLCAAGMPLARASLQIRQLHPQIAARSFVWLVEGEGAVEAGHEHGAQNQAVFLTSPVKPVFEGGGAIRRRLSDPDCPVDFPILADLKALGMTDYTIRPLVFSGGRQHAISIATREPGGFSAADLALFDATLPAFAAVAELQQVRRTARDLLSTYVGPSTGELIFSGAIKRGDGSVTHAVIWYCDLRGFTALSETAPLKTVIALLNDYFDRITEPVVRQGGEILKFIGDAVLAIFPCTADGPELCQAADAAVAAAEAALAGVAELNESCRAGGHAVSCDIALHVGEVMYGNIGAADRLDFTVVGPAVNLVTRLEQLCASLDCTVVVSAALARASSRTFVSLGRHPLRGIAEPQEAFTLP